MTLPASLSAMPMLIVATTSCPPLRTTGSRSVSSTLAATWLASSGDADALEDDHELVTRRTATACRPAGRRAGAAPRRHAAARRPPGGRGCR